MITSILITDDSHANPDQRYSVMAVDENESPVGPVSHLERYTDAMDHASLLARGFGVRLIMAITLGESK